MLSDFQTDRNIFLHFYRAFVTSVVRHDKMQGFVFEVPVIYFPLSGILVLVLSASTATPCNSQLVLCAPLPCNSLHIQVQS